jgi:hypothetical protein
LFDPNFLGDELPGSDENVDVTLVGNETYVTKRLKPSKISNLFKPKLAENKIQQGKGCDDSFGKLIIKKNR